MAKRKVKAVAKPVEEAGATFTTGTIDTLEAAVLPTAATEAAPMMTTGEALIYRLDDLRGEYKRDGRPSQVQCVDAIIRDVKKLLAS